MSCSQRESENDAGRSRQRQARRQMMRAPAALTAAVAVLLVWASSAAANPWWQLSVGARPGVLPAAHEEGGKTVPGSGELVLIAENVGNSGTYSEGGEAHGPIRVTDTLPEGLHATAIYGAVPQRGGTLGSTTPMTCSLEELSCEAEQPVVSFDAIEVRIDVEVLPTARTGETAVFGVYGGGAPSASVSEQVTVGGTPGFGIEHYGLSVEGEGGGQVTQAGAHPYQVTGSIALKQGADTAKPGDAPKAGPVAPARDLSVSLPPGLVADPGVVPRCLEWQFTTAVAGGEQDECPYESAVGVASITFDPPGGSGTRTVAVPVFDLEPAAGEPARFGFFVPIADAPVVLQSSVRSGAGEDWGVNLASAEIPESAGISSVRLTFWGAPGSSSHDEARGWGCLAAARNQAGQNYESCIHVEEQHPPAFVTLPSACEGTLQTSLQADSWAAPGQYQTFGGQPLAGMTGCQRVRFTPTISTTPSTYSASSPSGFAFALNFDTEGLTSSEGIAQSDLQNTTVELPEGLTIDPSAGVGLGACSPAQYASATLGSSASGCPENSKLGTVEIETPLLFTTIYGSLYVATPYDNPFSEPGHPNGSFIALYVVARSRAERGILVKLAGKVSANPITGRLSVSFENDPELPFARFAFRFREGAQAALISPPTCGSYTIDAQLTPFTAPESPLRDVSSFQITSGSEGAPCPGAESPFAPTVAAGTLTSHAGTFSPLYFELARTDAMSEIANFATSLPVGITADLAGVPFCPEANIQLARTKTGAQEENEPSCPAASLIGHSLVGAGVGEVLDYVPGRLYLAGPFHGDPFSVVSITSAVVGPFDLGTIVIRFGLAINPYTAQVSISPTGSEPIPTIIDGIVTHVRNIRVSIDRSDFTLNPTSCAPQPLTSSLSSNLGQSSRTSTTLQATGCGELAFKPSFKASTSAHTSRLGGASISVKLSMPVKLGSETNIHEVKVSLPRQLPARLPTLQQACTEAQFDTNPAGCPKGAFVGSATADTPILPVPLAGPAIFVSHGGEEFPSLNLLLQGYGVTVDLLGTTYVSPQGVISTTFKQVPDEPVGNFTLTLPEGPYSAVAAIGNLCHVTRVVHVERRVTVRSHGHKRTLTRRVAKRVKADLKMPTVFIAQNGHTIHRNTPIAVDGCEKADVKAKRHPRAKHAGRRRGSKRPYS